MDIALPAPAGPENNGTYQYSIACLDASHDYPLPTAPGRRTADRSRNRRNLKPAPIGPFIDFLLRVAKGS